MKVLVVICFLFWNYVPITDSTIILDAPYQLQIELKKTTQFNITWRPENGTTLSVIRLFLTDDSTNLLLVNATEWVLQGDWEGRASVTLENSTDTYTVGVTLENTSTQDEGNFSIVVRDSDQNVLESVHFQLETYALPVSLAMSVNPTNFTEGNTAMLVCTGNVGRPLGTLLLMRSELSPSQYFSPIESATSEDMATSKSYQILPDGTYSISHTFEVQISRHDNKRYFRCDVEHKVPAHSRTPSNEVQVFVNFTGSLMIISQPTVTLNSQTSFNQTLRCTVSSSEQNTQINRLLLMRINYYRSNVNVAYATIVTGTDSAVLGTDPQAAQTLTRLGATVSGQLSSQSDSYLQLNWNTSLVTCNDVGVYECEISYLDTSLNSQSWKHNASLNVQQVSIKLELRKNGIVQTGATESSPLEMGVGEVVDLSCQGEIGSSSGITMDWHHIRPFGTDLTFQKFTPGSEDVYDYGQPNALQCGGYERRMTLLHNMTAAEINRDKLLGFMCTFKYSEYGQTETMDSRKVYIDPVSASGGGGGDTGSSVGTAGSNTGAIAGGVVAGLVVIVLIVLLVYFLWYRRRSDGDTCSANVGAILGGIIGGLLFITAIVVIVWLVWFRRNGGESYRTKEEHGAENPNMVTTNSTDYAVPHKERRRAYENDGLDEPHQDRSRRRNDYGNKGRPNYGMEPDDDYNSADGSPTMTPHMSHMGSDPHGSIGTGV